MNRTQDTSAFLCPACGHPRGIVLSNPIREPMVYPCPYCDAVAVMPTSTLRALKRRARRQRSPVPWTEA
jgi:hypothetical protein